MPTTSRSGGGAAAPRGRRGAGRGAKPWSPIVDAAGQVAAKFHADNAMTGVNALDTAGDAVEAIGRAFQTVGTTITDEVDWDPRIEPFFNLVGAMLIKAAAPARDGAAAVRRAEQERIDTATSGSAKRKKWDVGEHM